MSREKGEIFLNELFLATWKKNEPRDIWISLIPEVGVLIYKMGRVEVFALEDTQRVKSQYQQLILMRHGESHIPFCGL